MSHRPRLATTFRRTLAALRTHNASRFGAALAFYLVFSIAPTLLIAIFVAGNLFGRQQAEQEILERIGSSVGSAAGTAIAAMVAEAAAQPPGWLATIFAILSLWFGLGGVYRQIDDALRTIWQRAPREGGEISARGGGRRVTSMLFVFVSVVVVTISVLADAAIAVTGKYAAARLVGGEWLWHVTQLLASTMVLAVLFAIVFRLLTRGRATWGDVRAGAVATAMLFVAGKFALGIYLGKAAVGSAFGAAGSIVVVLLWSYWSALIFFFGLELTHVYAAEYEEQQRSL